MKMVFTTDDYLKAGHIKSLLEDYGINCFTKNEYLTGGIGELPLNECWPEVWIQNDHDEALSLKLIASLKQQTSNLNWQCSCGEVHPGQFNECWKCGNINEEE